MKMTKIISLLSCLVLLAGLMVGCGGNTGSSSAPAEDSSSVTSSVPDSSSEVVTNELKTAFFDAHIVSAELVDEYGGKTPTEGGVFLKVEISVTNTMEQNITMVDTDFQAEYGDGVGALPMEAFNDEMAPVEYDLEPGEEATYTYVYEIADGSEDISIVFIEEFDNGETGETYRFPVELS